MMIERSSGISELICSISSLKRRIEASKRENERLKSTIQERLQENNGSPLSLAIQACTKAAITASKLQHQLATSEKKVAVKDDILLPAKAQKLEWANDKNCERKTLLSTLGIGLNVLEVGPEVTKIEFVVNSMRISTNYSCVEERFSREFKAFPFLNCFLNLLFSVIAIEPPVTQKALEKMQRILEETNDICGLLSAAKKKQIVE